MLVNKKKTNKRNNEKISNTVQSMRSWIRKIEQSTNSVSSRLTAVEKRITNKTSMDSRDNTSGLTIIDGSLDKILTQVSDGNKEKNLEYVFRVLDSELATIIDDIENQEIEIENIKNNIDQINKSIDEANQELDKSKESISKTMVNMTNRIEDLERIAPPTMKIGSMEIPIEISGITAGSIAIFAALMVSINKTDIITNAAFLGFAGILFIGATVFKTLKSKKQVHRTKPE